MKNKTGVKGEIEAKKYLEKEGYEIIKTNFFTRNGEIDIIAKEKDCVVFVEVKARTNEKFGLPCEAVNKSKQEKISIVALEFLQQNNAHDLQFRFDIIEYFALYNKINHIKNAFESLVR